MEWGSLIGIVLAFGGIVAGLLYEGGSLSSLMQGSAFFIVVSGTLGAVLLQNGRANFLRAASVSRFVLFPLPGNVDAYIALVTGWATIARREGLLALELRLEDAPSGVCYNGLVLIVDGTPPAKLREVLDMEIDSAESRLRSAVKVWESAGGYAPTVGILGAVLGLIHVMENLSDPSKLGAGIAVAFVATIYGVGLANLVFLPIASNLKAAAARQINEMSMVADGLVGIAGGETGQLIEARMRAYQ
jgi:chemotaxis protein MotA